MDTKYMQKLVDDWLKEVSPKKTYWESLSIMLQMQSEVGELSDEINMLYGEKPRKIGEKIDDKKVAKEMGDILFALACLGNKLEIDLGEAFQLTMNKFNIRDKYRHNNQ